MARPERVVLPGLPHHITHRGNHRDEVFRHAEDYRIYSRLLHKAIERYEVRLWAYSLMPNHVHLVAVPVRAESLSQAIRWAHGKYAELFNGLYDTTGHLWQGRFGSSVMDEHYLLNAVRYVERNPVRARLVNRAQEYPWSSAAAHCGLHEDPLISPDLPLLNHIDDWSNWLAGAEAVDEYRKLRECTQRGTPCGSEEFVRMVKGQRSANGVGDEGSDPLSPNGQPISTPVLN